MEKKLIFLFLLYYVNSELSCIDNEGNKIKWFIIYKTPGSAYFYLDSYMIMEEKEFMTYHPDITESALTRTLQQYYETKDDTRYGKLVYNDQSLVRTTDGKQTTKSHGDGHMKGILNFDQKSGYFVSHSFPGLPNVTDDDFPNSALRNAQHAVCITNGKKSVGTLSEYFFNSRPTLLIKEVAEDLLNENLKNAIDKNFRKFEKDDLPIHILELFTADEALVFNIYSTIHGTIVKDVDEQYIDPNVKISYYKTPWDEVADTILNTHLSKDEEKYVEKILEEQAEKKAAQSARESFENGSKVKKFSENDSNEEGTGEKDSNEKGARATDSNEEGAGATDSNEKGASKKDTNKDGPKDNDSNEVEKETIMKRFIVQSWWNAENKCKNNYHFVKDIYDIQAVTPNGEVLRWQNTLDHSKYGLLREFNSETGEFTYLMFCFSDLNHAQTKDTRGGGTFCTKHPGIIKAFTRTFTFLTVKRT